MKPEELVAEFTPQVERYKEFNGDTGKLGLFAKSSDWEQLFADARLAAKLRQFVEEHGDELWSWIAPDGTDEAHMRMALALEELLTAARGGGR